MSALHFHCRLVGGVLFLFSLRVFAQEQGNNTFPLDDGTILVRDTMFSGGRVLFKITNRTSSNWDVVELRFKVAATCYGERRLWSLKSNVYSLDPQNSSEGYKAGSSEGLESYSWTGCAIQSIQVTPIRAQNGDLSIDCVSGQRLDLKKQQQDAQREYAANEALAAKTEAAQEKRRSA